MIPCSGGKNHLPLLRCFHPQQCLRTKTVNKRITFVCIWKEEKFIGFLARIQDHLGWGGGKKELKGTNLDIFECKNPNCFGLFHPRQQLLHSALTNIITYDRARTINNTLMKHPTQYLMHGLQPLAKYIVLMVPNLVIVVLESHNLIEDIIENNSVNILFSNILPMLIRCNRTINVCLNFPRVRKTIHQANNSS